MTQVMYVIFTTVAGTRIKGNFSINSLKIKSETEFLISSGTFFQSYVKLLCSRILRFKCVEIFELKDSVHNIRRYQSKEIQCISGEPIYDVHFLRVFLIHVCIFAA